MSEFITIKSYDNPHQRKADVDRYNFNDDKDIYTVLMLFGNGCFYEASITGESKTAVELFIALMNKGSYFFGEEQTSNSAFYKKGFGCLPGNDPFIFVNPIAENGEIITMKDVHSKDIIDKEES